MVSTLDKMQVPNGSKPGVRRSKRPLLASRIRCKCSIETSRDLVIRSKSVLRSSSVTRSRLVKCLINRGCYCIGYVQECHVTFVRGRPHKWFMWSLYRPKNLLKYDLKCSLTYPCSRSLYESCDALRIKHSEEEQVMAYRMSCEIKGP